MCDSAPKFPFPTPINEWNRQWLTPPVIKKSYYESAYCENCEKIFCWNEKKFVLLQPLFESEECQQ